MLEFEKPQIEIKELSADGKYGCFVVEPLERGYGIRVQILGGKIFILIH